MNAANALGVTLGDEQNQNKTKAEAKIFTSRLVFLNAFPVISLVSTLAHIRAEIPQDRVLQQTENVRKIANFFRYY